LFGHTAADGTYVNVNVLLPLRSLSVPLVACVDPKYCANRSNISQHCAVSLRLVSPSVFDVVIVIVNRVAITQPPDLIDLPRAFA
jgi:hypothetical protein